MKNKLIYVVTILLICFGVTSSQAKPPAKKETTVGKKKPMILRFPSDFKKKQIPFEDTSKYGDITQEQQSKDKKTKTFMKAYKKVDKLIAEKKYAKDYAAYTRQMIILTKQLNVIERDPMKVKSRRDIDKKMNNLYVDLISKHFPEEAKILKKHFQLQYRYVELNRVKHQRLVQTKLHYHFTGKFVDKQNRPMPGVLVIIMRTKHQEDSPLSDVIIVRNQPDGTFDFIFENPFPRLIDTDSHYTTNIAVVKRDLFTGDFYQTLHEDFELDLTDKEGKELESKFLRTSKPVHVVKRQNLKAVMERLE